jgi:hypothetical protein
MSLLCSYIKHMFLCQNHVLGCGHVYVSRPCFSSRTFFYSRFFVFFSLLFVYRSSMVLCFYGSMFLWLSISLFPSIQNTFIHKLHHIFARFYVSCIIFLTCDTFSLVVLLLCFTFLGCFRVVIFSLSFL